MSPQEAWGTLKQLTAADIKGKAPELLSSPGFRQQLQEAVQVKSWFITTSGGDVMELIFMYSRLQWLTLLLRKDGILECSRLKSYWGSWPVITD